MIKPEDFYTGSAVNLRNRWNSHRRDLRRNLHFNINLQGAWNLYCENNFEFSILELCEKEMLIEREQFYFDLLKPTYNILPTAGSHLGFKYSDKSRAKMSAAKKGTVFSEEHKHKMSESKKGNTYALGHNHTVETCAKIADANRGKYCSDETRNKLSAVFLGKKRKGSSSEFHGVFLLKNTQTWRTALTLNHKTIHIGCFKSETEAAKAYNAYIIENNLPNPLNHFSEEVI